ncbi:UNVERIFIED_CONTAM: Splicing factor 3B subunit [Sesamum radiatum]|uniref:Splicing factor 3B subunit n=1 Tax=Sesamum radiatum TaxID=300843 RepID=A0AAW2TK87_SESRA
MGTPLYNIPEENRGQQFDVPKELPGGLPFMKPEDYQYFGSLLNEENEEELSPDEQKERKIMKNLLKVKNGTPPQRKTALRQLTDKAREFGAGPLFNQGREIISNLSKAAGLATMIAAMRPDIDNIDEYVRKTTARAFSKVRTITALSLAALAEAAAPYGIESFDSVLKPLWKGIRSHRGKVLAAFLKAIGFIIPLMDAIYASYYTKEVMVILIREFQSPDEEMKKIVLKVVKQCVSTEGVEADYIRNDILPEFFRNFWVRRMALDRRNYKQLVETTVEIANKVGVADIVGRIVEDLKDESEPYRRMVMETIEKVVTNLGASDIDARLEELLIDGILYAFQEQTSDDANVMLNGFGAVVNSLGQRVKPYLPQICVWRRTTYGPPWCVLYEYLGEEYPEVLGSILGALKAIVNVIGMTKMTPPIKDLLPRLTPILKNRHEKVQENCIDLVGRIADRGAEFVPAREWMRICFELLEMLKAHKKGIRRATVNTFGYIAKAIGPQDVLATLLNNLKVQERQNRVCTTVAIAIVAETCSPFTVLPALMNEYRVPELNVQNGVLKSLSFLFEYIGEMGKDYIYAVTPLLEDALMDRDLVHRQTAASAVKHMALGVAGLGCEDALIHLMNYVWPNIFETSPHVINAVMEAIEGMRVALGAAIVLNYCLQGLFHPARKVREVYWKIYNSLYIGAQDALVAAYPVLEDEENNVFCRPELHMFV